MANAFKLTEEIVYQVGELTALGVPIEIMAPALGVSDVSIYNWKKRGEELFQTGKRPRSPHDRLCVELFKSRKKGQSRFIANNLKNIAVSASKNWQASAWLLERRFPNYFGRIDRQPVDETSVPEITERQSLDSTNEDDLKRQYESYKLQFLK